MMATGQLSIEGEQAMRNRFYLLPAIVLVFAGCGQSAQEKYDEAVDNLTRVQKRLDNLRPAYDAAKQTAMLTVCKEISGTTPDESAVAMLGQLEGVAAQAAKEPAADATATPGQKKKPVGDPDAAIDQLISAQKSVADQQAAAAAPDRQSL